MFEDRSEGSKQPTAKCNELSQILAGRSQQKSKDTFVHASASATFATRAAACTDSPGLVAGTDGSKLILPSTLFGVSCRCNIMLYGGFLKQSYPQSSSTYSWDFPRYIPPILVPQGIAVWPRPWPARAAPRPAWARRRRRRRRGLSGSSCRDSLGARRNEVSFFIMTIPTHKWAWVKIRYSNHQMVNTKHILTFVVP